MSKPIYLGSAAACALLTACLSLALSSAATAQSLSPKFSGQISVLSDGIYRGVSQTDGMPQYIAGAQVNFGKLFIGTLYKSMRDKKSGVDNQIQAILGYSTNLQGYDVTARAFYKQYNGTKPGIHNEFTEYEVNVAKKLASATTGRLTLAYSPNNYATNNTATYAEVGLDQKITPKLTLMVANGFRHNQNSVDYTDYLVGARYALTKTFNASLTFTTTDKKRLGDKYGDTVFVTLAQKF